MPVNRSRIDYLTNQYYLMATSEEEEEELFTLLEQADHDEDLKTSFIHLIESADQSHVDPERRERILEKVFGTSVQAQYDLNPGRTIFRWKQLAVAASIALVISMGAFWLWWQSDPGLMQNKQAQIESDLPPGSNKAILTLADGSQVVLDNSANNQSLNQGGSQVVNEAGRLAYHPQDNHAVEVVFNTLATPRGGQYQLTMADGSKAWLNAASSIRYPNIFVGAERRVQITGEVYFEIEKNAAMPFKVEVDGMEIKVLGTHFNVNAYNGQDAVETTLVEGSVVVAKGSNSMALKPGQQAQVGAGGAMSLVENADMGEVLAWKNGLFQFNKADIKTVMEQIARWYDVEVIYEGNVSALFGGSIPRDMSASNVFKALELTGGVHFQIRGKTVIVKP